MDQFEYERKIYEELILWKKEITKRPTVLERFSKKAQQKINHIIPEKVHIAVTEAMKGMVQATLTGSNFTTKKSQGAGLTLYEKDEKLKEKLNTYRRTATIEGAGTGAAGFLMGLADFPLFLSIKMKFLFEVASIYGFDTRDYEERLFLLYVFQLAFSKDEAKVNTLEIIEKWEQDKDSMKELNWRTFQQEYRDYIDLVKLLQMVPGFGAIVGAFANYRLTEHLGETAMNAYRLRLLSKRNLLE
ncbi:EcsC family protein [Bacillus sp. CGMCC 1.16607]|uniref:EcsC family protein n=1 Tax=Bacillus sp. CGMCC 1.16607 TaxID=3351842 RepID=UPI00363F7831